MTGNLFKQFFKLTAIGHLSVTGYIFITLLNYTKYITEFTRNPLYLAVLKTLLASAVMAIMLLPVIMTVAASMVLFTVLPQKRQDENT